jgi:hypothetical protein
MERNCGLRKDSRPRAFVDGLACRLDQFYRHDHGTINLSSARGSYICRRCRCIVISESKPLRPRGVLPNTVTGVPASTALKIATHFVPANVRSHVTWRIPEEFRCANHSLRQSEQSNALVSVRICTHVALACPHRRRPRRSCHGHRRSCRRYSTNDSAPSRSRCET